MHQAREPVLGRAIDDEIRGLLAGARQFRPNARIIRHERAIGQAGPVAPDRSVETAARSGSTS